MDRDGFELLEKLMAERELKLGDLKKHVKQRYGDHRDWHPLARLHHGGYVSCDLKDGGFRGRDIKGTAESIYVMTLGPGEFTYRGHGFVNGGDFNEEVTFFPTAQADVFFEERRHKRRDVGIAVAGIVVGVVLAIGAQYLESRKREADASSKPNSTAAASPTPTRLPSLTRAVTPGP